MLGLTVEIELQAPPPTILLLMVGGGSRICFKYRAQIYGPGEGTLMDGSWCFSDPPDQSVFNGGGGGELE
jgi:hypothetical protein